MSGLETYRLEGITEDNRIGSIVMNCNPFTKGHLYLIEYAAKQVDNLYIFVVQEDKSIFKFDERLALVKDGTAHISNVKVIPSGKFIISSTTFDDYFQKDSNQDVVIDATQDLSLFGQEIAPVLGINIRFAGTEPTCKVTSQYNREMKRVLPKYGVAFIEIERVEQDEKPISASLVRAYLKEDSMEEIKKIVPETTYQYLQQHKEILQQRLG